MNFCIFNQHWFWAWTFNECRHIANALMLCAITEKLHLIITSNSFIMVYKYFRTWKKWQHLLLLIAISILIKSCNPSEDNRAKNIEIIKSSSPKSPMYSQREEKEKTVWNKATFDQKISKTTIYAKLDKQEEIYSAFEIPERKTKRTSDVEYSTGKKVSIGEFNNLKVNNCRAYFYQSDTLLINIGIGNGFSGQGFVIKYKDSKFYTEPYYFTDLIIPDEPKPKFKIVYQKLTLNEPIYKSGDSLYGYIDFKSIEICKDNKKKEHWGKGYFRARVTET